VAAHACVRPPVWDWPVETLEWLIGGRRWTCAATPRATASLRVCLGSGDIWSSWMEVAVARRSLIADLLFSARRSGGNLQIAVFSGGQVCRR